MDTQSGIGDFFFKHGRAEGQKDKETNKHPTDDKVILTCKDNNKHNNPISECVNQSKWRQK